MLILFFLINFGFIFCPWTRVATRYEFFTAYLYLGFTITLHNSTRHALIYPVGVGADILSAFTVMYCH